MEPAPSRTRRVYHRLQQALPQYLQELEEPSPVCFFDFTDAGNMTDTHVKSLYDQGVKPGPQSKNQEVLAFYFLLGRVFFSLGNCVALRTLRQWTTAAKAKHAYRIASHAYELFNVSGPEFIFVLSLSPTVLQEMSASRYAELLATLQAQVFAERLMGQAS